MIGRGILSAAVIGLVPMGLAAGAPAQARVTLQDDAHVTRSLVAAQTGVILTENCPQLTPRMIVATLKAWQLQRYATGLGFSSRQIDRFLKDSNQKSRIRDLAEAYLKDRGAVPGDAETYCAIGRAEIETGTLTGELLRED